MRCKYIFLIGLLLIINNAFAQWHFSVSISSNSDCGDSFSAIQASVEVAARIGIVEQLSAKTYNSQEDCEAERRTCTMNYSNSGCYIRTTTTPCQGNVGGGSGGGFYGEPSLHNNLAIGSDYFSQNEVHNVENGIWENEMLVQNDVLNKNWYNAVGAKTGDNNYDSKYAEEVRRLIKKFSKEENTTNNYNFISRKEIDWSNATPNIGDRVTLDGYEYDDYGPIVDVDPMRFMYDDLYLKSLEEEHPECFVKRVDNKFSAISNSIYDLTAGTYRVGLGFVNNINDASKYIHNMYGIDIPYSEKINALSNYLDTGAKVAGKAFVGDIVGVVQDIGSVVVEKAIDPLKDCTSGLVSTATDAGTTIKNVFVVNDALGSVKDTYWGTFEKASRRLAQGKNPYPNNELEYATIKSERTIGNSIKKLIKNH